MKNDTRNRATNRPVAVSLHCSLLVCFGAQTLMPLAALADTGLPPPSVHQNINQGFPSGQALIQKGYNPQTGVLTVNVTDANRPTVTSNGGTVTGTQNKNVTVTDKYGATGTFETKTTQTLGKSLVVKGIGAAAVASAAQNSDAGMYAQKAGEAIKQGKYGLALHNAVMIGGAILDGFTGGQLGQAAMGFGHGINSMPSSNEAQLKEIFDRARQNQGNAEQSGDFAGAVTNAAIAKTAEAAAKKAAQREYEEKMSQELIKHVVVIGIHPLSGGTPFYTNEFFWTAQQTKTSGAQINDNNRPTYFRDYQNHITIKLPDGSQPANIRVATPPDRFVRVTYEIKPVENNAQYENDVGHLNLTPDEVESILSRMLQSQQTNHQELMQQLAKIGDLLQKATTSQEWTAKTATTEPYTPAGSDTPQQTQFSIDKNGNITATTIPRPDLKPNSSQAPTRTAVIKNPTNQDGQTTNQTGQNTNQTGQQTGQTGQTTATTGQNAQQQSQQQQQNFCQQNPRAAACAELGDADYEDLEIPENVIDLNFEPADIFQTDGVCPQSKIVDLGVFGMVEFSYQPICDFAALLRPVLIAATIMMCAWFVFESVRDL